MNNANSNSIELVWSLYLYPSGRRAQLCCQSQDCSWIEELPGRFARLITLLQKAYDEDAGLPVNLRGFRQASALAKLFDDSPRVDPPQTQTITAYLYRLCETLKKPPTAGKPFPKLIVRMPDLGARLLFPVDIKRLGGPPRERNVDTA